MRRIIAGSRRSPPETAISLPGVLLYNGAIAFAITGMFIGVAGYATFESGVLPQWTGWLAYVGAALCAACYRNPVDVTVTFPRGAADFRHPRGGWVGITWLDLRFMRLWPTVTRA